MDKKRKGEIALKIWMDSGIEYNPDSIERLFGNMEKKAGVSQEELKGFARHVLADAYGLNLKEHNLSEERLGEVAYALLKAKYEKNGISLSPEAHSRAIGNLAERTQLDLKELQEFSREIFSEAYGKFLGSHSDAKGQG